MVRSPSLEALEAALEAMVQGEQLPAEQLSHTQGQLSGERVRRGEASAAAKAQLEAAAAQLAAAEKEANTAAQAREHLSYEKEQRQYSNSSSRVRVDYYKA